jgi:signal transduction histidine kinase
MLENQDSDEVDLLVDSFAQITKQLKTAIDSLEDNLRERTAELAVVKEHLEIVNQAKHQFITDIRHNLVTPLNAVLGFSELMLAASNLPSEQEENARIIHGSAKHLLILINAFSARATETEAVTSLTTQHFQQLPFEQLTQLFETVREADKERLLQLILAIPPTEKELINLLSDMAQQFQFERILDLIEPLVVGRAINKQHFW